MTVAVKVTAVVVDVVRVLREVIAVVVATAEGMASAAEDADAAQSAGLVAAVAIQVDADGDGVAGVLQGGLAAQVHSKWTGGGNSACRRRRGRLLKVTPLVLHVIPALRGSPLWPVAFWNHGEKSSVCSERLSDRLLGVMVNW